MRAPSPIALFVIGLVIQRVGWRWLSYGLILFVAIACLRQKTVHLQDIGVEVAAFGCLLTVLDPLRLVRNRAAPAVSETEGA